MRYLYLSLVALALIACNLATPTTPVISEPTPVPPPLTPQVQREQTDYIAYWRSLPMTEVTVTADDVVYFDQVVLRRVETATPRSGDTVSELYSALGFMLMSDNIWQSEAVTLDNITIEGDLATIRMSGEIRAVGGAILSLVPDQFLLTIFEQASIERVIITRNGEALSNLGTSHDSQLRPAETIITRESFFDALAG